MALTITPAIGVVAAATSTVAGTIEVFSDTVQSTAANAVTTTASRTYGLQVNAAGQGVVNVPWTDTTNFLALTGGTLTSTNSTATLIISDTGTSGGNIRFTGNGATTPSKTIRAFSGNLEVLNNAYSAAILTLTDAGALTVSGNVTAFSDERLKIDWVSLPNTFVEELSKIKTGTYTRTDLGERQAGSSAQAWQKLLPEVVHTSNDSDKTLSLAYGNAALVSAVELAKVVVSQSKIIESLEKRINDLEAKYNKEI
jgi:hypothetical protein